MTRKFKRQKHPRAVSGGGQQITALGAKCTVLDLSSEQIKSELLVAVREGYEINAVQGDTTKAFPFADEFRHYILSRFKLLCAGRRVYF